VPVARIETVRGKGEGQVSTPLTLWKYLVNKPHVQLKCCTRDAPRRFSIPQPSLSIVARFIILTITALLVLLSIAPVHAQDARARVYPLPIADESGQLLVDVRADGVENLGAFQFVLSWNPSVIGIVSIDDGPLLASSGRDAYCPDPVIERDAGAARLACVTFNPEGTPEGQQAPGAQGDGVLATARFEVLNSGRVEFYLSRVILTDPIGGELPSRSEDSTYTVQSDAGGTNGVRIAVIFVSVAIVVVLAGGGLFAWRRRSPDGAAGYPGID